ncbi:adenylyltransferase/cytidyltransferase family protein [Streptomyces cyaneofuscatus]|uniref:adenylyltransferase/cytidyltransferase family protein n=1 Tax=Streptomyces cyaneofuscatus TaxID=66883 RepID=UPI003665467A
MARVPPQPGTWAATPPAQGRTDLLGLAARVRARGGKAAGAGGCFDLLHSHLSLLEQARRPGEALIVCIICDAFVCSLKGEDRPVVGEPGE